ncbi:MAG: hypothetical protein AMS17_17340 [Spirochaetes bacterium DG_61]|nr:MAG: hypothetical protein AMS17_17340 [Spirochaetes bacterium DG_61]
MPKFAHLSDCHIGAWRDVRLRELNLRSFEIAVDSIIDEQVDFLVISGDLFHVNLPDLDSVRRVVTKLREAKDSGIPAYAVYGSHDYSPNATAMVDILASAGLLTRVVDAEVDEGQVKLRYISDPKTGVKLCGLSGRSYALERHYYEVLDRASLEDEEGFRIFVFHSAIEEIKPAYAAYGIGIQASYLPRGLEYYAGGHIHQYIEERLSELGIVVYPGTLFGSTFSDLELYAKGVKRGYVIVEFEDSVKTIRFMESKIREIVFEVFSGDNRSSKEVEELILTWVEDTNVYQKIVLIKVEGVLSSGKVTEINFNGAREELYNQGAEFVSINRRNLITRDIPEVKVVGETPSQIEEETLREALSDFFIPKLSEDVHKWVEAQFKGENGVKLALKLLQALKTEKQEGETNYDFEERILRDGLSIIPRWEPE